MNGFADKAMLLLPTVAVTKNWSTWQISELVEVVRTLGRFLEAHYGIRGHVFNCLTNGYQISSFGDEVDFVHCICPQDRTFYSLHGVPMFPSEIEYPHAFATAISRCKLRRGLSEEARDADVSARMEIACKEIIRKEYKIIFDFEFNRKFLRYESQPNDGKIVYMVRQTYYISRAFMSGNPYSASAMLNYDKANTCMKGWS